MKKPVRILIVEDITADVDLAKNEICRIVSNCEFQVVETYEGFLGAIETFEPDVIISDYTLPHFDGLKALALTQKHAPLTPFLMWSGSISESLAIECMRAGANNYIFKDNIQRLGPAILHALEERNLLLARKQAEEALKERERQLGILLDNLPGPVYRCRNDAEFTMEFISDGIEQLSGYRAQDFRELGRHFGKIIHPDDQARVWMEIQTAVESDQPFEIVYRIHTATGEEKWVREKGQGIRDEEGQLQALEGFITDITVRKQTEEKYQSIFQNSMEGIFQSSPQGFYLNLNLAMARLYGYDSPEEMIASIHDIATEIYVEPEKRSEFKRLIQANDGIENFEAKNYRKDGCVIWTSTSARAVCDQSGNVLYYEGSIQDITQRKQTEEELQNKEKHFRALIENGLDDISLLTADGSLLWESPSTVRNLGYQPDEFVGHNIFELMHPDDLAWTRNTFAALLQNPEDRQRGTFRLRRSDGDWRWVEAIATNMLDDASVNAIVINYRDITEQKQAEAERQANLEIIQGLANTKDLQELLKLVHHSIAKVIYAENFYVCLFQESNGLFEEIYSVDQFDPPEPPSKLENSITSYVFRSGEPLLLTQASFGELAARGEVKLIGTDSASWLGVPLKTSGRTIGVMAVQDYENDNRYSEREKDFLTSIATQVALVIERKRSEAAEREQRILAEALRETAETLSKTLDYGKVLDHILTAVERVVPHDAGSILLIHDEAAQVVRSHGYDKPQYDLKVMGIRLPLDQTTNLRQMMETRQPVVIYDTYSYPGWQRMPETDWLRSSVGAPISIYDEIIGFICLDSQTPAYFTPVHAERLEAFANQAAIAIHNARLLQQAQDEIAERKRSEDLLRQSEERFSSAFEYASIGMALVAPDGRWLRVNGAVCQLLGYSESELLQKTFQDITHPDDLEADLHQVNILLRGEVNSFQMEKRYFHKSGQVVWALLSVSLVWDDQGKPRYFISQIQDISERKQAEVSLQAERERAQNYLDIAEVTMLALNRDGIVTLINQKGCEILGYSAEEIIGKDWISFLPEDIREEIRGAFQQFMLGHIQQADYYENRVLTKSGEERLIAWHNTWLRDVEGAIIGSLSSGEDITARKKAEIALMESNTRFQMLFEASPDAIVLIDPNDGWAVVDCNTVACQMNGYSREELLGQSIDILNVEPPRSSERAEYLREIQQQEILHYETSHRRKDGSVFEVEVSTSLINVGNRQLVLGIDRDITERKRAENELRFEKERFESIAATVPGIICTFRMRPDGSTCMPFATHAIQEVYGFLPSDLQHDAAPLFARVHPDDLPSVRTSVRESAQTMGTWHSEFRYQHPIKGEVWIEGQGVPLHEADGSTIWHGFINDVTERKKSEAALMESNIQFRTLFEASPDAIVLIDPQGNWPIIDCNTAACQLNGYSREELIGQPVDILNLKPSDVEGRGAYLESIRQAGVLHFEEFHKRKDGTVIAVDVSTSLIQFGTRDLILGIDRDITERKRVEEEIRRRAEETSALLETSLALTNLDLEATLQTIGNSANTLFLADGCRIFLTEPDDTLRCVLALGENTDAFLGLQVKVGEGVTGAVAAKGMPEIVNEMQNDPRAVQVRGTDEEQEAIMFAPLKERDRTIGILSVRRLGNNRRFEQKDLGLLEAFASMAASAVSNARLFEETRSHLTELRASEERFRQLADNIQEGFWMTDAENDKELYMSPAVETIWGQTIANLLNEPRAFVDSIFPEDRRAVLEAIEKEKSGERAEVEYRIIRPDGSLRWIWDRAFPVFDESGKVKRIAGISADITERKQAEHELRKLSRAVEQSSSTIVITDTSGTIEYVNPKFTEITGYSFEEVIGRNPRFLKSGFTAKEEYTQLWQTITSGGEWHGELLNKKKDGTLYWESVTISPIMNDRREITHFVGVKEDITERKQSEIETRRHIAELEAVYENGLSVGRLFEPGEIGNRVIETFSRYLPWHHVTIRLRKEDSDNLELVAFSLPHLKEEERTDAQRHFVARVNKVGQGLSGWVIQTGTPLRTGNVHAHPQYIDTHTGIQSGLYMPLKVGERVIGVISVESEAPNAFTEQDQRLLATLANQTAVAFENAHLYEAMQKELSERRRVEDALRVSETHYRALADSITDILFELDQDLHYTHWNKASEALTGIPASHAVGKSMEDVLGRNEEQSRIKAIYEDVLQKHQPRTFETILTLNGESRSFEVTAYPSMRGVSVVAKDVTDRKRTEMIMQKRFELMEYSAKHSLNDLMQKTVDEVSELTSSTIGFFHFMQEDQIRLGMQTWSTNALQLFHVSPEDGAHLPLDGAGVWAEAVRQRRPLIQNDYELLAKKKGVPQGHVPILREMVIPIIRNERIMAVMGIGNKAQEYSAHDLELAARLADYAWDITERKQMEIALELERNQLMERVEERTSDLSRANSNLARALRVKDEFLANMSHELRTPLNAILGLSESLGEQIAGPLNEKQQKYISTISESGHHLLSLINDILDLAKIDAGHITLDINKVDVRSVCNASLRMIKQLAQKKNQDVSLEIDDGLGLMWADERRLKQMIVNLLGNAVKFTPEHGKLGLEVHGDEEANQIAITVWDNGIGIKEDDLARLFQPFVQLDSGLAREATGTGLGLVLVAQMARLHGGSVNVVSEAGKGSRFSILLPWEPALILDSASRMKITGKFRAIQSEATNKPTILLVEDTQEVVMMLKDYLELAGYNVFTAQDGIDGIVQAKHVKPDLILMDVQMPRMNGFETTRKLRSDPTFRYTPIIALTALAMPHDRERCLEAGMDEYISKPVNLKALVKIIQSCLFKQESRAR